MLYSNHGQPATIPVKRTSPLARRALLVALGIGLPFAWACSGPVGGKAGSSGGVTPYAPPVVEEIGDGWLGYVDAPVLDAASAAGMAPGQATPEAAVVHFYASRIRGDERYREVLTSEPSGKLERNLERLDEWSIERFTLVARKERSPGLLWIKVWFEIEVDGDVDSGEDEVGVRHEDGRWVIESVPT